MGSLRLDEFPGDNHEGSRKPHNRRIRAAYEKREYNVSEIAGAVSLHYGTTSRIVNPK